MAFPDLKEILDPSSSSPATPSMDKGDGSSRPSDKKERKPVARKDPNALFVQKFLIDRNLPVAKSQSKAFDADGIWGPMSNKSLGSFLEGRGQLRAGDEAVAKYISDNDLYKPYNYKQTIVNLPAIKQILTQRPKAPQNPVVMDKPDGKRDLLEKPKDLQKIDFTVDGKVIKNFPITFLASKVQVGNKRRMRDALIYMVEFLKTYGAIPGGETNWESLKQSGALSKAIAGITEALDKSGYPKLANYLPPLEQALIDIVREKKEEEKSRKNIFDFLAGEFSPSHRYHELIKIPGVKEKLGHYLRNQKLSDANDYMIASESKVGGNLSRISDYLMNAARGLGMNI